MLKLLIINLIVVSTFAVEVNRNCPGILILTDFDELSKGKWYEIYATEMNPDIQCTTIEFSKDNNTVTVRHEGKKDKANKIITDIKGDMKPEATSLYHISNDTYQSIVIHRRSNYVVIHECEQKNSTIKKSRNSYFILSRKPYLNYMDFLQIDNDLRLKLGKFIKFEEFKTTNHYDPLCNSCKSIQVLSSLIFLSLALIKIC